MVKELLVAAVVAVLAIVLFIPPSIGTGNKSSYGEIFMNGEDDDHWHQQFRANEWGCVSAPTWDQGNQSTFFLEEYRLIGDGNLPGVYRIEWSVTSSGEDVDTKFGISLSDERPLRDCIQETTLPGHYGIQSGTCLMYLISGAELCLQAMPIDNDEMITMKYGNLNVNYVGD